MIMRMTLLENVPHNNAYKKIKFLKN